MTPGQDVVIIGGGISGVAAAYELARRGIAVTLVEKGELASMASGWTLGGVRQSGRHPAELPLAQAAVRRWEVLTEELEADVEYRQQGNLRLARTPEEAGAMAAMVAEQQAFGLDLTYLPDHRSVLELAPALSEHVIAASYCPTDGHANPTATVRAFAAAAVRLGANIQMGTKVESYRHERRPRCRRGDHRRPSHGRRGGRGGRYLRRSALRRCRAVPAPASCPCLGGSERTAAATRGTSAWGRQCRFCGPPRSGWSPAHDDYYGTLAASRGSVAARINPASGLHGQYDHCSAAPMYCRPFMSPPSPGFGAACLT